MGCPQPVQNVWLLSYKLNSKTLPAVENVDSYAHKDPGREDSLWEGHSLKDSLTSRKDIFDPMTPLPLLGESLPAPWQPHLPLV